MEGTGSTVAGGSWARPEVVERAGSGTAGWTWVSVRLAVFRTRRLPHASGAIRINSQNPCVVVASAILRRPRLMPSARSTLSRPMRSRQGSPVRRCSEGLGEPGGVVHLEQDVGDPRLGQPTVEVGDQVGGPVRHGGFRPLDAEHAVFDAPAGGRTGPRRGGQPAQTLFEGEPALGPARDHPPGYAHATPEGRTATARAGPEATEAARPAGTSTRPQEQKTSSRWSSRPARSAERSVSPRVKVSVAASTPSCCRWIEMVSAIGSTSQYSVTPCAP